MIRKRERSLAWVGSAELTLPSQRLMDFHLKEKQN
jgi:hypothetical protein